MIYHDKATVKRSILSLSSACIQNWKGLKGLFHFADWGHDDHNSPKIFIYDLPESMSRCHEKLSETWWQWFGYGAEVSMPAWIRQSTFVTAIPEEADFFYVNAKFQCGLGPYAPFGESRSQTISYLQSCDLYLVTPNDYWRKASSSYQKSLIAQYKKNCEELGELLLPGLASFWQFTSILCLSMSTVR